MLLSQAIEALKEKDFGKARLLVAQTPPNAMTPNHFLIKGLAELALQSWAEALKTFDQGTNRYPETASFWFNKGVAQENLGQTDAAIESHNRCLALSPQNANACGNLSNLYRAKGDPVKAEMMAQKAFDSGAPKGEALNCLALALEMQGKTDAARQTFDRACKEMPDNADFLVNRANLEVSAFNFDQAWNFFARARTIIDKPVYRHHEGLARLLAGDYLNGFTLSEARLLAPNALRQTPTCPRWQGEDLNGKSLLILAEQGVGDVIHFARYQSLIKEGTLVWAVPTALVRLLSGSLCGTVVDEKHFLPPCDYYLPLMSLPLETNACSDSCNIICPDGLKLLAPASPTLPKRKRQKAIGLVWAGSRTHKKDFDRSIQLDLLAPVFERMDADFYAPFLGDALKEIGNHPIIRLDDAITDFADTAALLKQMDCLVSVDTAVAHLAGALGVKTYLLLPYCPDWRWGTTGEKTQLYPSICILRQKSFGDWGPVINGLATKLETECPVRKINP